MRSAGMSDRHYNRHGPQSSTKNKQSTAMSAGITAIDLVDSDLLERLKSAVDTTKRHYAEKGSPFVSQVIAHLVAVVHELSTRATMYPVALVTSRIHLDDETKELVRRMQTVINEHPADMAERLERLATKMQERIKSSTPMDDGTLWLPDEHVKECKMAFGSADFDFC
jgi:hexokinase